MSYLQAFVKVRFFPRSPHVFSNEVMRQFFAGRLRAIVDEVVPLADGAAAQQRLAEGKQFGKIVLKV